MTPKDDNDGRALGARVIYVAGNGRSGSTLLDLVLGDNPGVFSAGEITFVAREGLLSEYCGCGEPIGNCDLWRAVFDEWTRMQPVGVTEYRKLRKQYELNRSVPRLMLNLIWSGAEFRRYCRATEALLITIQKVTGATTIIDSSKTPGRIRILSRFADLTVVHLCRDFSGVLNSMSKAMRKELQEGVEVDLHPVAPGKALFIWLVNNALVELFSIGLPKRRVHYIDLVTEANDTLQAIDPCLSYGPGHILLANHMLAGNKIRLKPDIRVNPTVGFAHHNLSPSARQFGKLIDRMFWFWAKR